MIYGQKLDSCPSVQNTMAEFGLLLHLTYFNSNSSSSLLPNFLGTLKSSLDDYSTLQETLDKMKDFLCTYTNCQEWSNYVENVLNGNLSGICQSSIGQNWCQICTDECSNSATQYSSYEVMLNSIWAMQKLMTSKRAYQYIFNGVFDNTCGFPTMKPIETIGKTSISASTASEAIEATLFTKILDVTLQFSTYKVETLHVTSSV